MNKEDVIQDLIAKTLRELQKPNAPVQQSRTWQSPNGFKHLVQWSNAVLLRYLIRLFTTSLPKSEYRRKAQLDDAGRSVVRNIEEGWKRSNTATYLEFIGFSQGSLEEVKGDIRELTEDGFLPTKPGSSLKTLGLNLADFNKALKPNPETKGDYRSLKEVNSTIYPPIPSSNPPLKPTTESKGEYRSLKEVNSTVYPPVPSSNLPLTQYQPQGLNHRPINTQKPTPTSDTQFQYTPLPVLYPPLKKVRAKDLTYEIFIELINKTDYLLRTLVESLEKKLQDNRLGYQIAQAKIKDQIK